MNFKIVSSERIFDGKVFDLVVDKIQYDNTGNLGIREVAEHPGGAVVLPLKGDKVIMVTQYRYPLKKVILELPAGKLDKDENPDLCVVRELEEETGYTCGKLTKLGAVCTSPGFCTEILHLYLAEDLKEGNHNREEGEEGMEMFEYTFDEIEQKIASGEIIDAKSISAIYLAQMLLKKRAVK